MDSVMWLDDYRCKDASVVGGKASGLARLMQANIPIPYGFVITDHTDDDAIISAFRSLPGPLAVRSSGVDEDGAGHSFAGIHESRLHISTQEEFLDAVRYVAESFTTDLALDYRRQFGLHEKPEIRIVVQRMVNAQAAAVVFTHHPITGDPDNGVMEICPGYGDKMVNGEVTPWTFKTKRIDRPILVREGDGELPFQIKSSKVLHLYHQAWQVHQMLGVPVDTEWAFNGNQWLNVQARPITTIKGGLNGSSS